MSSLGHIHSIKLYGQPRIAEGIIITITITMIITITITIVKTNIITMVIIVTTWQPNLR